ncbi:MAG: hypothetical protein J6S05_07510 [Bacteroidaceae bacterium]|nr:hypothetical protein [Bacteroidaceae bacterium]
MMKIREYQSKHLLNPIFEKGLSLDTSPATYFFDTIYAPIRLPTASGLPPDWTYLPVGWSYSQIAEIYAAYFGGNFWPQFYRDTADLNAAIASYSCEAVNKIVACLELNQLKYKKLIELQGYEWNPLYNVDGETLRAHIEQHGGEEETTDTDVTHTTSRTPYDTTTPKEAEKVRDTGSAANNKRTRTHLQDAHSVSADYNAFGEALTEGDSYHAERELRRGNIGVTKTTELIEAARKTLSWSVLNEFFKDLNEVLLIGIF